MMVASMALLALTLATGAMATRSVNAPPVTFTDETGDSGTAADITTVAVTNDDKGQYFIDVNFATPYGATGILTTFLDTDLNAATGDPQLLGADYAVYDDHANHAFSLLKWNGTAWDDAPSASTVTVAVTTDSMKVSLSVNKSDLGDSTGFNFFIGSADGDGSAGHVDVAPSGLSGWQYKLQTPAPLQLSLGAAHAFAVKAGGTWNVALIVTRSDTGATVGPEGTLVCSATSGSTKLAVTAHAFISGGSGKGSAAVCSFKVPKKLRHKVLHATVTVSYQGQSVTHSFTTTAK
jgi:hypothetical protein